MSLPTLFNSSLGEYDKTSLYEVCELFHKHKYQGTVVIKSTVEPETINILSDEYPSLNIMHNPEFLTARTSFEDFHKQSHIVLGKGKNCSDEAYEKVVKFYSKNYKDIKISKCDSIESETMKCFVNCFYSVKVQFFTELYLTCQHTGGNFNTVVSLMLANGWINPMHTNVPGPDGSISYGGACFPKDMNAMNEYMKRSNICNNIFDATIKERNQMRDD